VAFFYNKELLAKAGVDAESIKTWTDFLAAVSKLKEAGITPIIVGAGEKWPMHFYWSYLVIRIGGAEALTNATSGEGEGFNDPVFVQAGEKLQELTALEPFQDGWLATTHLQAAGLWGDGKGAFQLMGSWLLNTQKNNATDGKGLAPENIGIMNFPVVEGGKGAPTDTLGGINGWLVTEGSPPEAVKFLEFFLQDKYQRVAAEKGFYIPSVLGTEAAIADPLTKRMADDLAASQYHQIFFDQDLGPSVGRVVNDISVAVAAGEMSPDEAAASVQQAWEDEQ
jgi:raffinose/stachyose/melibiose transport system substrate-binding protein